MDCRNPDISGGPQGSAALKTSGSSVSNMDNLHVLAEAAAREAAEIKRNSDINVNLPPPPKAQPLRPYVSSTGIRRLMLVELAMSMM